MFTQFTTYDETIETMASDRTELVRPRVIHSDLLDGLLGPVDPVELDRVRQEMLAMRFGLVVTPPEEIERNRCKAKQYLFK